MSCGFGVPSNSNSSKCFSDYHRKVVVFIRNFTFHRFTLVFFSKKVNECLTLLFALTALNCFHRSKVTSRHIPNLCLLFSVLSLLFDELIQRFFRVMENGAQLCSPKTFLLEFIENFSLLYSLIDITPKIFQLVSLSTLCD